MKILCITDIHGNNSKLPFVIDKEKDVDLIIFAGDITHLGGYKEAEKIIQPLMNLPIKIIAIHGNMDQQGVIDYLEEHNLSIHGKCISENNMAFLGLGGSNPTPFHTPQEYSDAEGKLILENALSEISEAKTKIFVSHTPPKDSKLDIINNGKHVGSTLVRDIIKSYNMDLCLCGHIHESSGIDRIGESLCVNTGALRDGNYVIIDIIDNQINVKRRKI